MRSSETRSLHARTPETYEQVVVVGGGYIGVETAAGLSMHEGVEVTVVLPEAHLMARIMPPGVAAYYEEWVL